MKQEELARENHLFLVTQVPNCLFGDDFQGALWSACKLMRDIGEENEEKGPGEEKREVGPDDFCQCGFENGYVGVNARAGEAILGNIGPFKLASALYFAFKSGADTGAVNDRVTVFVNDLPFVFTITDYETDDLERGWIDVTANPLIVPCGQTIHRRVIISLAN
jgi:hypothetical protein